MEKKNKRSAFISAHSFIYLEFLSFDPNWAIYKSKSHIEREAQTSTPSNLNNKNANKNVVALNTPKVHPLHSSAISFPHFYKAQLREDIRRLLLRKI